MTAEHLQDFRLKSLDLKIGGDYASFIEKATTDKNVRKIIESVGRHEHIWKIVQHVIDNPAIASNKKEELAHWFIQCAYSMTEAELELLILNEDYFRANDFFDHVIQVLMNATRKARYTVFAVLIKYGCFKKILKACKNEYGQEWSLASIQNPTYRPRHDLLTRHPGRVSKNHLAFAFYKCYPKAHRTALSSIMQRWETFTRQEVLETYALTEYSVNSNGKLMSKWLVPDFVASKEQLERFKNASAYFDKDGKMDLTVDKFQSKFTIEVAT